MTEPTNWRASRAIVDTQQLQRNAEALVATFAPSQLCAVVKADGYGHGSVQAAKAFLAGGASRLAVALVEEGVILRDAGIEAPIMVLSEPRVLAMPEVVRVRLTPTLYSPEGISALASAAAAAGVSDYPVHLKVDTGMHRVGAQPADVVDLVEQLLAAGLQLEGLFTHFAVADEPDDPFTTIQADRFDAVIKNLASRGWVPPQLHASNSAGGLTRVDQRMSFVRAGIALYGLKPSAAVALPDGVEPAMSVVSEVSFTKRVSKGERLSYGQRYELAEDANIATVPIGYADGLPRLLSAFGGDVLIRGKRYPVAGTVTMDQIMVDLGDDPVAVGDEVIIFGRAGDSEIRAEEIGERTGTLGYEIICRMGPRLPRHYVSAGL